MTSYSHRGRFYTLREIARFGSDGLWSRDPAWFSRYGTLLATAEAFIKSIGSSKQNGQVSQAPFRDGRVTRSFQERLEHIEKCTLP